MIYLKVLFYFYIVHDTMRIIFRIKMKNETELCETDFKEENPFHLSVQKKVESLN